MFQGRGKHIKIHHHFIRDVVIEGLLKMKYCAINDLVVDGFTKGLCYPKFIKFWNPLGVGTFASKESVEDRSKN